MKTPIDANSRLPANSEPQGFVERVLVVAAITSAAAVILGVVFFAPEVLLLIFGGVLLAVFLRALGELVTQWTSLSSRWSLAIVLGVLVLLIAGGVWLLGSEIVYQFDELMKELPKGEKAFEERLAQYEWGRFLLAQMPDGKLATPGWSAVGRVSGVFFTTLGAAANLVVIVFLGVYAAVDPGLYRRGVELLVPREGRQRAGQVLDQVYGHLRGWLLGRLASMIMVGVATAIGLWLLGMPAVLALALIAFVLDFVPFVGPIVAAIPGVLLAATFGLEKAATVAAMYLVVQSIENFVVIPLIAQHTAQLPPVMLVSAQVILFSVAGVLGMVFASPITVAAMTVVKMLYVEDALGEEIEDVRIDSG